MATSKKSTASKTVRLFWQHVWRYPRYVIGILISVPLTVLVTSYLPPLILASVLNRLGSHDYKPHQIWASFGPSLLAYGILVLGVGTFAWRVVDLFMWRLEAGVQQDIAQRVYRSLLEQDASFHANRFGGSLVSQNNKLMSAYIRFADTTIFQVMPLVFGIIFATIILAGRTPLFAVLLLLFAVVFIVVAIFITRNVRDLSAKQAAAESEQTGYLADSVTNVMAVKSFAGSSYENRQFAKATAISHQRTMDVMRGSQRQMATLSGLTNALEALALVIAVIGVMVFKANLATVFLIFSYTANIANQLFTFGNNSLRNYNRSLGDAADMTEILQLEPDIKDPAEPEKLRISRGQIEFKDVDFAHEGAGETLFQNLNVRIKPGEKVGLVGHSGSGKTTFTRLLLRFSDIDSGEILIDGQNIARITQDDLRRSIAYVPQEPIMFHRSLRENIRYGDFQAKDDAVFGAAKIAHAHDFIKDLPEGYETLVGERGVKLSGGQRQRIAIARAMLKNAPILLLDEATSALDSESEVLIQDALWKLMEGRTAIVIAHRLSTIQKMDRIIVMDDGKIVEQGSHKELVNKKDGTYSKLWAHQSGGFMEE